MPILDNTTDVMMILVRFFQFMGACVTLKYPRIRISIETALLQSDIWPYSLPILVVQNKVSNQR